ARTLSILHGFREQEDIDQKIDLLGLRGVIRFKMEILYGECLSIQFSAAGWPKGGDGQEIKDDTEQWG
ncbi:MAG: hypothetical protein K6U03_10105, partial [Firmicutes bacterium]|nr:hypothetical protein [Bacillota bacterium]